MVELDHSRACRATSPSSWTATAAGRSSAACPGSTGIASARTRCAPSSSRAASSASSTSRCSPSRRENWNRPPREVDGADDAAAPVPRERARQDDEERASACSRSAACAGCRPRCATALRATHRGHAQQHGHDGDPGRELRRPRGHRARPRARSRAASSAASSRPRQIDEDDGRRSTSAPRASPIPIC